MDSHILLEGDTHGGGDHQVDTAFNRTEELAHASDVLDHLETGLQEDV